MSGGGGDAPRPLNGGRFLLQLLQNPPVHPPSAPPKPPETLSNDPAVAAVGPTIPFSSPTLFPPSNGSSADHAPYPHHQPPLLGFAPHVLFPQNPNQSSNFTSTPSPILPPGFSQVQQPLNFPQLVDDIQRLKFSGTNVKPSSGYQNGQNLIFGSFSDAQRWHLHTPLSGTVKQDLAPLGQIEGLKGQDRGNGFGNVRGFDGLEVEFHNPMKFNRNLEENLFGSTGREHERSGERSGRSALGRQGHGETNRAVIAPPGFTSNSRSPWVKEQDSSSRRSVSDKLDKGKSNVGELNSRNINSNGTDVSTRRFTQRNTKRNVDSWDGHGAMEQLDFPGPAAGVTLNSVSASEIEKSMMELHGQNGVSEDVFDNDGLQKTGKSGRGHRNDMDNLEEQLVDSLGLDDISDEKNNKVKGHDSRGKDYRSDKRGKWILPQRDRFSKRRIQCRRDIDRLNAPFLAIYDSLIPAKEEKAKQKQLLALLEKLVTKEWPDARLYVYGSCANSFGFSKSDIDVCLAFQDMDINKSEVLLKLAEMLLSDNLQKVQALTRARVPIVKLMDPATGISCDICINNVLAVINTKLLRDYAQIDSRLRQLAFIVKHWAKSRGVNETYQGTLSSYAYVLMCIHFLQMRRPAILPCLQEMEPTYSVTVDNIECAYFDRVEKLNGFGLQNQESVAKLVWAFFNYWAYCHDYTNDVISVRTGHILSKGDKDWTRRIGNDRHLICIEDPFETSHDLGRVVDKSSIRVLREEFERAAEIMQYDPDPCAKLFEPYVPN